MATNIEVIVGTYEHFLLGYKVEQVSDSHAQQTPIQRPSIKIHFIYSFIFFSVERR